MHIITGLILASVFGNKKSSKAPFAWHTGPIITKHQIDGRIRYEIQKLKQNQTLIDELLPELQKIDGVQSCAANAVTGSLLIYFDPGLLQSDLLFSILAHLLQVEDELETTPPSFVEKEIQAVGGALNRAVYDQSRGLIDLKTAIPLSLAFVAMGKIAQEGWSTFPPGMILLLWAYQSFSSHGE
ncbi:hypothetical protein K8I31_22015 [bacterium]|nr:hypothetical protein [bacterium]